MNEVLELLIKLREQMSGPLARVTNQTKAFEHTLEQVEARSRTLKGLAVSGAVFGGMAYVIKEGLEGLIEPAEKFASLQNVLQRATGASAEQMKEFAEQAHALASTLPVSAESVAESQATLARMLGGTEQALKTAGIAAQFATATNMSAQDAAQLLGSAYVTMGDKTKPLPQGFQAIADKLALLQTKYSTSVSGGDQLARSFAHVAEASQAYGVSINQSAALLGVLNRAGLGGGRGAGNYAQEIITQMGKLDKYGIPQIQRFGVALARNGQGGIDLVKTLANLRSVSQNQATAYIKSLGSAGEALALLYQHYDELKDAAVEFGNAAGETGKQAALAGLDPAAKFKVFQNTVEQLKESLGNALLPVLVDIADILKPILISFSQFAEAHPVIMRVVLAGAALLGMMLAIAGSVLVLAAGFGEITNVFSLMRAGVTKLIPAMLELDGALLANPLGLLVALGAAAAVIGYEVAKHWDSVVSVFKEVYNWGAHLISGIVDGIKAGMGKLHDVMHHIGTVIKSYLPFSPAKTGPLADLHKMHLTQMIAAQIKPAPIASAMGSTAGAVAGGASGGGGMVYSPQVSVVAGPGASGNDLAAAVLKALREHADEFYRLIDRQRLDWNRTGF